MDPQPVERTEASPQTQTESSPPAPENAAPAVSALASPGAPGAPAGAPLPAPRGPRVIALMNQKGGVGKTTTTVNLGAALALAGHRVLLIDLDPQAHLSIHVGLTPEELEKSVYHLLTEPAVGALDIAHEVGPNLAALPAEVNLAGVESELAALAASGRAQQILRNKVAPLLGVGPRAEGQGPRAEGPAPGGAAANHPPLAPGPASLGPGPFDYCLIDCPPSLGLLTINALALADEVFVPMQAHFLALQGLSKLLETVGLVKQSVNPRLAVTAVILCLWEGQTVLANEVLADLTSFLEAARAMDVPWRTAVVLRPPVRRNIKLAECPSFGKTIFDYAPQCPGAQDYRALAEAVGRMAVVERGA